MGDLVARLQSALGDAYRIERELGGGGMSRVFLAQERELERQVVVKVLPPEMAAGLNAERFRREIQLAASLQHPHIVPLLPLAMRTISCTTRCRSSRGSRSAPSSRARGSSPSTKRRGSYATWLTRWPTRTSTGSSTATSSPTTC